MLKPPARAHAGAPHCGSHCHRLGVCLTPDFCVAAPIATLLAGVISFASGSAMGTMGILFPLVLPLAETLSRGDEARPAEPE